MIAETKFGKVEGKMDGRFYAFLGVPFAKAPEGELRWKAPVDPEPWDGVLDATEYGYQSIQGGGIPEHLSGKGISEDCLNVNIWTPGVDDKKRPVIVMFSGGGSTSGGNNNPVFSGQNFIKDREIVYIFANFRLGFLGFLYLGHLLGEEYQASGSCGLMDQIFALKWIHENVANFGGDPDNVTIMGQSAGGKSVCNLMLAPAADGLYNKAISMSGGYQVIRDLETARVVADRFLELNGIAKEDASKLLTLPWQDILDMQYKYHYKYGNLTGPVYDGVVLPIDISERLQPGAKKGISVLIGHVKEEAACLPQRIPSDEECLRQLANNFGTNAPHVFSVFKERCADMARYEAWTKVMTKFNYGDSTVRYSGKLAAAGAKVWSYRWDYPGYTRPEHGSDLGYVCGYMKEEENRPLPHFDLMCRMMNESFLNFIEFGDPQTADTGEWKPYTDEAEGTRMYFCDYPSAEPFSLENYDHEMPVAQLILREE